TVFLFGRLNLPPNKWVSCCVVVKNIFRQVFFLPRQTETKKKFVNDGTIAGQYSEEEVKVLEVQYESNHPRLSSDLFGETFSAVFNATATAMERLLVEKAMMCPGWVVLVNYA
ncbi:hypothetical protein TELCIR_14366, partial [Teladorsagia circumcincta]